MALDALWVEKYRPKTIGDYVFPSDHIKNIMAEIVSTKNMPHLLFTGGTGTGKTTLALVLADVLLDDSIDFLKINASDENSIDILRGKIKDFASTWPMGNYKIILLDECDLMSFPAQAALRQLMETESNTCRFIMTANYPSKIINALKSRTTHISFPKPDINDITEKAANVLVGENVDITDIDVLDTIVRTGYPDLRKVINLLQEYTIGGKLTAPSAASASGSSWEAEVVTSIKNNDFADVYATVLKNVALDEYESLYTLLGNTMDDPQGIIYVADYMFKAAFVSDQDLNFKALCHKLNTL